MLVQTSPLVEHVAPEPTCCTRCSARIIEAGDRERRRLERDLHDGAQQRLVSLALQLGTLGARLAPGSRRLVAAARQELGDALRELRDLAHGIHPAVLTDRGLAPRWARSRPARRCPWTSPSRWSTVRPPPSRSPPTTWSPRRSPTSPSTRARPGPPCTPSCAGRRLVVVVTDDGIGGARMDGGSGLRGLADRVEALGGTLRVSGGPGTGMLFRAEIPIAKRD